MFIDWFTVAAQIANFLVLIWLLKRFLYRPILDGIDRREADIAARIEDAEAARMDAEAATGEHRAALAVLDGEKADILEAARAEAAAEESALRLEKHAVLESEQAQWRQQIENERAAYLAKLRAAGAQAIFSLTAKALKDLADVGLEDQIAGQLESRLSTLGPDLRQVAQTAGGAVAISSFPLSKARRDSLRLAFSQAVDGAKLTFRTDPHGPLGLTIRMDGLRLGWTVESYLDDLEVAMNARLDASETASGAAA
ncbi:MAG TPA: F0F1 ATP synthase subunit B [Thermohalobaculum sp.]|nr:F0F1 ATP synthase subunit B [Thermohalobaculum sp.]